MNPQLQQEIADAIDRLNSSMERLTRTPSEVAADGNNGTLRSILGLNGHMSLLGQTAAGPKTSSRRKLFTGLHHFSALLRRSGRGFGKRPGLGTMGRGLRMLAKPHRSPSMPIVQAQARSEAFTAQKVNRQLADRSAAALANAGRHLSFVEGATGQALASNNGRLSLGSILDEAGDWFGNDTQKHLQNPELAKQGSVEGGKPSFAEFDADCHLERQTEQDRTSGENSDVYCQWMEQAQTIGNEQLRQADERIKRMRDSSIKKMR